MAGTNTASLGGDLGARPLTPVHHHFKLDPASGEIPHHIPPLYLNFFVVLLLLLLLLLLLSHSALR